MRRLTTTFIVTTLSVATLATFGCGGSPVIVPENTLANAKSWQILLASDYENREEFDNRRVDEQRGFLSMVAKDLEPLLSSPRSDSPQADLIITLEEYLMSSDVSGRSPLQRRELAWEVQFFNAQGDRIGRMLDRDQSSGHTAITENRAAELAHNIARALGALSQTK